MRSKWCFFIRFWMNLSKKDSVVSAKYEINKFSICTYRFTVGRFLWIRIRNFGWSGSGLRKKSSIRIRKKPGSETLVLSYWFLRVLLGEFLFVPVRLQCNLSRVNCRWFLILNIHRVKYSCICWVQLFIPNRPADFNRLFQIDLLSSTVCGAK